MAVLLPQCCYLCASADICTGTVSFVSDLKNLTKNNHYGTFMELVLTRRPLRRTLRCCTLFVPKACRQQLLTATQNASSCWSRPNTAFLNTVSCGKRPSCVARTPEHPATVSGSYSWWCVYLCVHVARTRMTYCLCDLLAECHLLKHSTTAFCSVARAVRFVTFREMQLSRCNKTHFISGADCYMFRHQGAMIRECVNNIGAWG